MPVSGRTSCAGVPRATGDDDESFHGISNAAEPVGRLPTSEWDPDLTETGGSCGPVRREASGRPRRSGENGRSKPGRHDGGCGRIRRRELCVVAVAPDRAWPNNGSGGEKVSGREKIFFIAGRDLVRSSLPARDRPLIAREIAGKRCSSRLFLSSNWCRRLPGCTLRPPEMSGRRGNSKIRPRIPPVCRRSARKRRPDSTGDRRRGTAAAIGAVPIAPDQVDFPVRYRAGGVCLFSKCPRTGLVAYSLPERILP